MEIMRLKPEEILAWCDRTECMAEELYNMSNELKERIQSIHGMPMGSHKTVEQYNTIAWQFDEIQPQVFRLHENMRCFCENAKYEIMQMIEDLNDLI